MVEVELTPPASRQIQVQYSVEGSSAVSGSDYSVSTDSVVFQTGDSGQTFQVNIIDDSASEGNESIFLNLRNPSPGVVISNSRIEIIIIDND